MRGQPRSAPPGSASTSSRNTCHAGSAAVSRWLLLLRATSRESGISAASSSPARIGCRWSSRECMISVGHDTWPASSRTSMRPNSSRNRTAFSGEVVRRCNWSKAAQSARVPSGRNCAANTCRNAGSSRPQPTRARSRSNAAARLSSSLTARARAATRVCAAQHQLADPFGVPGGVGHRDRAALGHPEQREAVQPECLDHRLEIADPVVEAEIRCAPVG